LTAHGSPDCVQLLTQYLGALVCAEPARRLRRISIAQIEQRTDDQLGCNALPEVGAASDLEWDNKLLQGRLHG
jgi:hypothetical protein